MVLPAKINCRNKMYCCTKKQTVPSSVAWGSASCFQLMLREWEEQQAGVSSNLTAVLMLFSDITTGFFY